MVFHVTECLVQDNESIRYIDESKIKRIVFREITKKAILKAVENPEWIHVHYDIDPIAKTAFARIGAEEMRGTVAVPASTVDPSVFVEIGVLGYNLPAPAAVVHLDNVTVDFP